MNSKDLTIEAIDGGYIVRPVEDDARILLDPDELLGYLARLYAGEEGIRRWRGPHLCEECNQRSAERLARARETLARREWLEHAKKGTTP